MDVEKVARANAVASPKGMRAHSPQKKEVSYRSAAAWALGA